jgi:hypothetical protein
MSDDGVVLNDVQIASMGSEIAGVLGVGDRINGRNRAVIEVGSHVDEGEQAGVGERLAAPVATETLDASEPP